MSVNLEYYRTFYQVAELGSMGKAAGAMQLTPPTITKTIQMLEQQLNCQLFVRTPKGVRLTQAGEILYARIKPGLSLLDSGEFEVNQFNSLEGGSVRIGVSESAVFNSTVSETIRAFCMQYPSVRLTLNYMSGDAINYAVQSGDIDFALFSVSHERDPDGLTLHKIAVSDNIPVVGRQYADYVGREICLKELATLPLVSAASGFSIQTHYRELYKSHGLEFTPRVEMPTLDLQIRAVSLGIGYSFVPREAILPHMEDGSILAVHLKEEPVFRRDICLLTSQDLPLSRAARVFTDMLLDKAFHQSTEPNVHCD